MNQRARKLMTMHKALHMRVDIDKFIMSRKEGRRGLDGIEDWVEAKIQGLKKYKKRAKKNNYSSQ